MEILDLLIIFYNKCTTMLKAATEENMQKIIESFQTYPLLKSLLANMHLLRILRLRSRETVVNILH